MWTLEGFPARRVWNSGELLNSRLHPCGNELHFGSQLIGFGDADGCPIELEPLHETQVEKGPLFQSFPCEDLVRAGCDASDRETAGLIRSEEHTSELQSPYDLVCRLLLEKKKKTINIIPITTS